jgi:hypothetical protein
MGELVHVRLRSTTVLGGVDCFGPTFEGMSRLVWRTILQYRRLDVVDCASCRWIMRSQSLRQVDRWEALLRCDI